MMYKVRWCGHDGGQKELCLDTLEEAAREWEALRQRYGYAEILPEEPEPTGVSFEMDQELLCSAVEIMRDAAAYYQADACALARLDTPEAKKVAQGRLESAKKAEALLLAFGFGTQ